MKTVTLKVPEKLLKFANARAKDIAKEEGTTPNRSALFLDLLRKEKRRVEKSEAVNGGQQ